MKYAYIFVERSMNGGYGKAYPPVGFVLDWMLRRFVRPFAEKNLEESSDKAEFVFNEDGIAIEATWSLAFWKFGHFAVYSYRVHPDPLSADLHGRPTSFTMHAVLPESFALASISSKGQKLLFECRKAGWNIDRAGCNPNLKIPIPEELVSK